MTQALLSILLTLLAPGGYHRQADLAYGEGPRRTLDVYTPRRPNPGAPVVVFFYGGSWDSGTKGFYRFVGAALASRGVVAVIPDYRVYPQVNYPGFVEDGAQAVKWTRQHAADYGADPDKLVLMGHSAGAHIAALLAYDRRWLNAVGMDPDRDIRAMVGLSGPYDFLPLHSERLKIIFGDEESRQDAQPINHVDGRGPPGFFGAGDADTTVDPRNSSRLASRINQMGGHAEVKIYPGVDHPGTISAFLPIFRHRAATLADSMAFITAHTQASGLRPQAAAAQ
jgi:acetyl esterase/lipase